MTDDPAVPPTARAKEIADRRSTRAEIASAIDLGWRVAALHALDPMTLQAPSPVTDDMLLNRRSLSAADRADLEVRAIAGVAARVGIPMAGPELDRLLELARACGDSTEAEQAFRHELARRHIEFDKRLWAVDEPSGKAYELGNFLSDTWNRVLRPRVHSDPHSELAEIFGPVRVQRMKLLLDDLQARVDPVAAHTVETHLGLWRDRVQRRVDRCRTGGGFGAHGGRGRQAARAGRAPDGHLAPDADRRQGARGLDRPRPSLGGPRRVHAPAVEALPPAAAVVAPARRRARRRPPACSTPTTRTTCAAWPARRSRSRAPSGSRARR